MTDDKPIIKRRMTTDAEVIKLIKKYFSERQPDIFRFGELGSKRSATYRIRLRGEGGEQVDIEVFGSVIT